MNKPLLKITALAVFAGLSLSAMQAHSAAIINGSLIPNIENNLEDTDADRILRNGSVVNSGNFMSGDILEALLRFETVNGTNINVATGDLNYQMVAYSQLVIPDDPTDMVGAAVNNGDGTFTVQFAASGNLGAGVLAEVYENTAQVLQFANDPAAEIAQVLGTTLIAEFGLSDADDFWTATLPLNIATLATNGAGSPQNPAGVLGLTLMNNPGMLPIETNGIQSQAVGTFHDIVGSASAFANPASFNTGWLVATNTEIRFNIAQVPEPGIVMLMGAGLLGAGFVRKRVNA